MKYIANPVVVDAYVIEAVQEYAWPNSEAKTYGITFTLGSIILERGMTARYAPKVGDYYVVQEDSYAYINPKEVLERKYRPLEN